MANAALQEGVIAHVFASNPFVQLLGITFLERNRDAITLGLPFRAELNNSAGTHHGGAISAFVDTAAAVAVWNTQDFSASRRIITIGMSLQYLRAAPGEDLVAVARCAERVDEFAFVEIEVSSASGVLLAVGHTSFQAR